MDGLFFSFGTILSGHFKVLQKRIESLDFSEDVSQSLENLITYHKELIDGGILLIENYKEVLIGLFVFSSCVICVLGFSIVTVRMKWDSIAWN